MKRFHAFLLRLAADDWQRAGLTWRCWLLVPLSVAFGAYVALRRLAFRLGINPSTELAAPVVVVGNIVMGGAGKTPMVIWLVEQLRAHGFVPGVISRGYGGSFDGTPLAVSTASEASVCGDEPVLIATRTGAPVVVAHDRVAAGQALLAANPGVNVIVADDGLQHYALQRATEVVVFDERGLGNGWLFPAGPLRERVARVTGATACVVQTKFGLRTTAPQFMRKLRPETPYALEDPLKRRDWRGFSGRCHALAGIAHPPRFSKMLISQGVKATLHAFPDHHRYSATDLDALPANATVLMTEKDSVKLRAFAAHPALLDAWVVPLAIEFADDDASQLMQRILTILKSHSHGPKTA